MNFWTCLFEFSVEEAKMRKSNEGGKLVGIVTNTGFIEDGMNWGIEYGSYLKREEFLFSI